MADETNITPFPRRHTRFWAVEDRDAVAGDLGEMLGLSVTMAGGPAETIITIRTHDLKDLDRLCRIIVAGSQSVKSGE